LAGGGDDNTWIVTEPEEELQKMIENSNENTAQAKRKKRQEDGKRQDLEESLGQTRKGHTNLLQRRGKLEAEKKVSFPSD
jgi:dsDNA-specific endonuclease/ATPase MutS2